MTLVYSLICFLINLSIDFFFRFEEFIIYCFHAEFVFNFALNLLIAVYRPKVTQRWGRKWVQKCEDTITNVYFLGFL